MRREDQKLGLGLLSVGRGDHRLSLDFAFHRLGLDFAFHRLGLDFDCLQREDRRQGLRIGFPQCILEETRKSLARRLEASVLLHLMWKCNKECSRSLEFPLGKGVCVVMRWESINCVVM